MSTRAIAYLLGGLCWAASSLLPAFGQGDAPRGAEFRPIGRVQSVTGPVAIEHTREILVQASAPSGAAQTKVDDPVYLGDVIQTAAGGAAGIIFGDGTSFNVSENARMEVNEFVYDPKSSSNSTLFNLTRGTFTFLAGKTAKTGNMRVETPVGTMGIRGTAPHVEILDNGTTKFTTLIEEHKNASPNDKSGTAPASRERRAQNSLSPDARPKPAKEFSKMLDICRGC